MSISTAKHILIFSVLIFLFFISGFSVPIAGIFFLPFSSVSLVLLLIKTGSLSGAVGILLSSLAVYKIIPTGYVFLLPFGLFVVLNSVILYYGIIRKNNPWQITLDSCFAVAAGVIIAMLSMHAGDFQTSDIFGKIAANMPKEKMDVILRFIVRNIYAVAVIFAVTNIFLSYIFLSAAAPKFNITLEKLPAFEKWRMPEGIIFVLIFSILFYLIGYRLKYNILSRIFENLLYLMFFLYFIGGMAIGKHFLGKSPVTVFISYLIFFLYPPVAVFLGISDIWLDFRKKRSVPVNTENKI